MFAILIGPISELSFILKAIEKMYYVNTTDESMFYHKPTIKPKYKSEYDKLEPKVYKYIENNMHVRFSTWQSIKIMISSIFGCFKLRNRKL